MIIPLTGAALPQTADLFREQMQAGWSALGVTPRSVELTAPGWPAVSELQIDLSGARVEKPEDLPRVLGSGEGALEIQRLQLRGHPVVVRGLPLSVDWQARAALFQMARLSNGGHALVLRRAEEGTLVLSANRGEMEKLTQQILAGLARQHGADVVKTELHFTQRGPRGLSFQAEVTAKVMIMKAPIALAGDLDLSDDLQLHLANLRLTGSGMVANLARGFLQPHLDKLQQKPISLAALALGEVRLRDVSVAVEGETLRLQAKFGS